eukprot:371910-Rhodomonas_salina.1
MPSQDQHNSRASTTHTHILSFAFTGLQIRVTHPPAVGTIGSTNTKLWPPTQRTRSEKSSETSRGACRCKCGDASHSTAL